MPISKDDKDWTWVLERACPDCGFDASSVDPTAVAAGLRALADEWTTLLAHPAAAVRPSDDRWSALEYGCHVRDAFRIFDGRLQRMLDEHDPAFANWDQDATAESDGYATQDPTTVAEELVRAAATVAERFEGVASDAWDRPGSRSDGARFTVGSLGRYLLHDPVHHVWDVRSGYDAMASAPA